jgi:hypothetical protein
VAASAASGAAICAEFDMINIHSVPGQSDQRLFKTYLDQAPDLNTGVQVSPEILLNEKGWIVFELDFARNKAVFLDIGVEHEIIAAPFFHLAAPRVARRLALVNFDVFLNLAKKIRAKHHIVQFYNIGHCGSTLLHNVVNESGEAWDISEPKFTNVLPRLQLVLLARACLDFLSLYPRVSERKTLFVKHVSHCTQVFDLWHEAAPEATNIFMFRDAVAWCNSLYGFVQRNGLPQPLSQETRRFSWMMSSGGEPETFLDGLMDFNAEPFAFGDMAACAWGLHLQQYQVAKATGMKIHAFRYNELLHDREGVMKAVFAHCGLDATKVYEGLKAFDHDSHAGEKTAHDKPVEVLTEPAKARIEEILRHPRFAGVANDCR